MRHRFPTAVVVITLALSASCSTADQTEVLANPEVTAAGQSKNTGIETSGLVEKIGMGVPVALSVLESSTISGDPFTPSSLAGREVLLWFWAPW